MVKYQLEVDSRNLRGRLAETRERLATVERLRTKVRRQILVYQWLSAARDASVIVLGLWAALRIGEILGGM